MQDLSNEEIEACREAFAKFDKDGSGAISDWELRAMLQCAPPLPNLWCIGQTCLTPPPSRRCAAMGQDPTDEELFDMIAEVDMDGSGEIGAEAHHSFTLPQPDTALGAALAPGPRLARPRALPLLPRRLFRVPQGDHLSEGKAGRPG